MIVFCVLSCAETVFTMPFLSFFKFRHHMNASTETPTLTDLTESLPSMRGFFQAVYQVVTSMRFAVAVLVWLLIAVLLGVFLPQETLLPTAQIKQMMGTWYYPVRALGGYQVFASAWFLWIQVLLLLSVTLGSWQWLLGAWKQATVTQWSRERCLQVSKTQHLRLQVPSIATDTPTLLEQATQTLRASGYEVFPQNSVATQPHVKVLYATKARWTRLGPHITHLGIILTLLAGLYGYFTGFKAQALVLPGESFTLTGAERVFYNAPRVVWLGEIPRWVCHVEAFRVQYYPEAPKVAQNYFTTLKVRAVLGETETKYPLPKEGVPMTISVNKPLKLPNDVTIYQASYEATGNVWLSVQENPKQPTKPIKLMPAPSLAGIDQAVMLHPLSKGRVLMVFPFIATKDNSIPRHRVEMFIYDPQQGVLGFKDFQQGLKHSKHRLTLLEGESGILEGLTLTFHAPEMRTGLQVKRAPEVAWMYLAFLVLSLGVCISFIPQRQIWLHVYQPKTSDASYEVVLNPKTRKGWQAFYQELAGLQAQLTERWGIR